MKTTTLLLLLGSLLSTISSYATDYSERTAYEIEVVIFEHKDIRSMRSEIWPDLVKTAPSEGSINLHYNSSKMQKPGLDQPGYYYSILRDDQLQLDEYVKKIEKSGDYELLYHKGWIQPGLDEEEAEAVHISTTEDDNDLKMPVIKMIDSLSASQSSQSTASNSMLTAPEITATAAPDKQAKLEGTVKVVLGRYLHLNFDLTLKRDFAPQTGVLQPGTSLSDQVRFYPIQTHRRMRSKEIHYIDHPLVGILVLATPYEPPVTEEQQDQSEENGLMRLNEIKVQ